jgi:hypothetical protein
MPTIPYERDKSRRRRARRGTATQRGYGMDLAEARRSRDPLGKNDEPFCESHHLRPRDGCQFGKASSAELFVSRRCPLPLAFIT